MYDVICMFQWFFLNECVQSASDCDVTGTVPGASRNCTWIGTWNCFMGFGVLMDFLPRVGKNLDLFDINWKRKRKGNVWVKVRFGRMA